MINEVKMTRANCTTFDRSFVIERANHFWRAADLAASVFAYRTIVTLADLCLKMI